MLAVASLPSTVTKRLLFHGLSPVKKMKICGWFSVGGLTHHFGRKESRSVPRRRFCRNAHEWGATAFFDTCKISWQRHNREKQARLRACPCSRYSARRLRRVAGRSAATPIVRPVYGPPASVGRSPVNGADKDRAREGCKSLPSLDPA